MSGSRTKTVRPPPRTEEVERNGGDPKKTERGNSENLFGLGSGAAALRFPGTGALAALPGASARGGGELARAGRALAAGVHRDGDLAIAGDLAVDGGGARSLGDEG